MFTSEVTIRKIGNSLGAIFSSEILKALDLTTEGSKAILSIRDDGTAILKAKNHITDESPFNKLNRYAPVWREEGKSAIAAAEEIKETHTDKDLDIIW